MNMANFNNDKRLIKKTSITFSKLKSICNNLDIKATLVMEDKDPNVPNPMGEPLSICITDVYNDSDDEGNGEEE